MTLYKKRKSKSIKGTKTASEIFYEAAERLFDLLVTHPHFTTTIENLRKRYKINPEEIQDPSGILLWEAKQRKTRNQIREERKIEALVDDFTIAPELKPTTALFTYDYLLTNKVSSPRKDSGINVIRVSEDDTTRALNPAHVYLEITPFTTFREIKDHWKRITDERSEIRGYGVPSKTDQEFMVWQLYQQGLTTEEVTKKIKAKYKWTKYGYNEILKLKSRYKTALDKLKPLE